ncbi:hypothetical protein IV203_023095 [Nitzschia inconspicua]|uniref:Uncharacterized protein n=1 Tax=Nitzschia inconspicua TaxID=303405 RepID=A0A9K3PDJ4_9STRA|nr:hypothetical protein IV203_023095 [Nitzschia inconspicua]
MLSFPLVVKAGPGCNALDTQRIQRVFPSIVPNDTIWKQSQYPEYQSIVDMMSMVHQYQKEAGLKKSGVFIHLFQYKYRENQTCHV